MLTKWVGQAWRELHANNSELIRQTFCNLGLSLAVDGSEDEELSIRDLPGIDVGDWRLTSGQINEQQVEDPVEIDESTIEAGDSGISGIDTEYVLGSDNDVESQGQVDKRNDNSEMEDNDLEGYDLEDDGSSEME